MSVGEFPARSCADADDVREYCSARRWGPGGGGGDHGAGVPVFLRYALGNIVMKTSLIYIIVFVSLSAFRVACKRTIMTRLTRLFSGCQHAAGPAGRVLISSPGALGDSARFQHDLMPLALFAFS
jgi:hypothetical protein